MPRPALITHHSSLILMNVLPSSLPEVLILEPEEFGAHRVCVELAVIIVTRYNNYHGTRAQAQRSPADGPCPVAGAAHAPLSRTQEGGRVEARDPVAAS